MRPRRLDFSSHMTADEQTERKALGPPKETRRGTEEEDAYPFYIFPAGHPCTSISGYTSVSYGAVCKRLASTRPVRYFGVPMRAHHSAFRAVANANRKYRK